MFIAWLNGNVSFATGDTLAQCQVDCSNKLPEIFANLKARHPDRPECWQRVLVTITEGARQRVVFAAHIDNREQLDTRADAEYAVGNVSRGDYFRRCADRRDIYPVAAS